MQLTRTFVPVHSHAAVLLQHHRENVLEAEEHADDIDVEHAAERLERIIGDRLDLALDAGIVEEHINGSELVAGPPHIGRHLRLVGYVGGDCEGLGAGGQGRDGRVQILFAPVDGDDAGAARGQQTHGRGADESGRAGDDGHPAVETNRIGHSFPSLPADRDAALLRVGFTLSVGGPTISLDEPDDHLAVRW